MQLLQPGRAVPQIMGSLYSLGGKASLRERAAGPRAEATPAAERAGRRGGNNVNER